MSLETLWTKLTGRQAQRQASIEERWSAAVAAIADAKPPAEAAIDELLTLTRRTVDDLKAAVERVVSRRQARAALDAAAAVPAERARIAEALQKAESAYNAAVEGARNRYAATAAPLEQRGRELDTIEKAGREGAKLLVATNDTAPAVHAQIMELNQELNAIRQREGREAGAAGQETNAARNLQARVENEPPQIRLAEQPPDAGLAHLSEKAAAHTARAKVHAAAAAVARAEADALAAKIAELRASLLAA